jgi:hypothetical protein
MSGHKPQAVTCDHTHATTKFESGWRQAEGAGGGGACCGGGGGSGPVTGDGKGLSGYHQAANYRGEVGQPRPQVRR